MKFIILSEACGLPIFFAKFVLAESVFANIF